MLQDENKTVHLKTTNIWRCVSRLLRYASPTSVVGLDRVAELCLTKAMDILIGRLKPNSRSEKKALEAQITGYRLELAKISQVDEFAKYSKIQRKLRSVADQLSCIKGQERELNFKYILGAQAFAWLIAVIFCFRIVYSLSASLINSLPTFVN